MGSLVAVSCWERAPVLEGFALAMLVPVRKAQVSNLKRGEFLVLVQPRDVCCSGVGFHLSFFAVTKN